MEIVRIFEQYNLEFSDISNHQTMFSVEGKTKNIQQKLLSNTKSEFWDGEGGQFFYKDAELNLFLYLRPIPKSVLVFASVKSLHGAYLATVSGARSNDEISGELSP